MQLSCFKQDTQELQKLPWLLTSIPNVPFWLLHGEHRTKRQNQNTHQLTLLLRIAYSPSSFCCHIPAEVLPEASGTFLEASGSAVVAAAVAEDTSVVETEGECARKGGTQETGWGMNERGYSLHQGCVLICLTLVLEGMMLLCCVYSNLTMLKPCHPQLQHTWALQEREFVLQRISGLEASPQ